ncbi:MAG: hypothetical protein ACXW2C_04220 [Acidimicrobiia bacterium]
MTTRGDRRREPPEFFVASLHAPPHASIARGIGHGIAVILDDD